MSHTRENARKRVARKALTAAREREARGELDEALESFRLARQFDAAVYAGEASEGIERIQLAKIRAEQVDPVIVALCEVVPKIVAERVLTLPSIADAVAWRIYQALDSSERWRNVA